MIHAAQRMHAFINGLFRPKDEVTARALYGEVERLFSKAGLDHENGRIALAIAIAEDALDRLQEGSARPSLNELAALVLSIFDFERLFLLPAFDWSKRHSIAEYWALKERLVEQQSLLAEFERSRELITLVLCHCLDPIIKAAPATIGDGTRARDAVIVPTDLIHTLGDVGSVTEAIFETFFADELVETNLFARHRDRLERNLVAASGGNPADPKSFTRAPKLPAKSEIRDPVALVETYLGGTPIRELFDGAIPFAIPASARFEHHHIVAGSGHGKTRTLQYMIAKDLEAVQRGERSVIVLDSQGDLINRIANLKLFAPGEPLHERIVLIDPTDVEYPVSLNLFDVGLERLDRYSQLDRERLTNSILELYDFVLGSLLAAEMTQKQSVIFRYVTRLMLHIPDATIHTLRELMEKGSEIKYAEHIARLKGSARHFFETEFAGREFTQTRQQVLRRLWGILENQTFERMFSHPRSKLDLFSEMNAGKVILINTAKDLLKESGTEIFGRFFIALIAQAAQERATLPERKRMPTFVYIDEAADYFDRNIGIILSQARKYNVGMVLAHQYLGQLDAKLQEAFSANTSIKFAGGVSAKDARSLAPMMACEPGLIESQPKLSFAAHVRGITRSAVPLKFPYGLMEGMPRMSAAEHEELKDTMRAKYAIHYSELEGAEPPAHEDSGEDLDVDSVDDAAAGPGADGERRSDHKTPAEPEREARQSPPAPSKPDDHDNPGDPDTPDTDASPNW
jgi:hypothetical protein